MKVCIPSLDDGQLSAPLSGHFGRAPNFTLYDTDAGTIEVIENDGKHHGGARSPPELIADTGADVLVCGNLGRKAVDRFDDMGIEVYCGAEGRVQDAIDQYEAETLEAAVPGGDYCDHADEGHEHGHGQGHHENHEH